MGASGLGALLVKEGFLTEQDRVTITKTCGQGSWAFAKCILSTGLLDEDELSAFFAERTKYVVAPKNLLDRLDPGITEQIDRRMVSRLEVLPLEIDHHRITVAVADPLDKSTIKQLEFFTGLEVVPVIAPLSQIYEGLSRLNPEFRPRFTALSNFLRNHAGTAWIKQKIIEDGDVVEAPQARKSSRQDSLDSYNEDEVEEVSLDDDDEEDSFSDASDDLNDIDTSGLDEGIGNSDFDDIELDDSSSDLDLSAGDDPDVKPKKGPAIDDEGLDIDDPFDSFEDSSDNTPKAAAPEKDLDLDGLESGGADSDDLWPDLDDAPAKPAAKAAAKPAAKAPTPKPAPPVMADDDLEAADALPDDFGFDDEPAAQSKKPAAAAESDGSDLLDDDSFGLDEEPDSTPMDSSASEDQDEMGSEEPENLLAEEADDSLDALDDAFGGASGEDSLEAESSLENAALDDKPSLDDDAADLLAGLDDDEPIIAQGSASADEESFDEPPFDESPPTKSKPTAPRADSTRMVSKPNMSVPDSDEDELEFDSEEETSISLRKAVHAGGKSAEFADPSFDSDEEEETRIDLHAAIDDELSSDFDDEVSLDKDRAPISSRSKISPSPSPKKPVLVAKEFESDDEELDDLAQGLDDAEAIDDLLSEPAPSASSGLRAEPQIGDLNSDALPGLEADLDLLSESPDQQPLIDLEPSQNSKAQAPRSPAARAAALSNGSAASLTATAKANEALLRMSLCFDKTSALEIAREYLPQISATGCLIELGKTTEAHATWRSGAQSASKTKQGSAFQRMAKDAKLGEWSQIPVNTKDDLFGSVKTISVYKIQKSDGRTLLLAGDYPLGDETLRDALTSFAEQLGAK